MANTNNVYFSVAVIGLIVVATYFGSQQYKQSFLSEKDDYHMIKQYLLNDSPLKGFDKPKIWIHTKYEINTRKWKTFYSRNTTDLNQPYIHLTVKTIINHCGDDFNICLIDDDTFSKLIPSWEYDMNSLPEPMKSRTREYGLMQLIYYYGGMVVPNSFLCLKNLRDMYYNGIAGEHPFVCENTNRTMNLAKGPKTSLFIPDSFIMGAKKNDPVIHEYIEHIKKTNRIGAVAHFDTDIELLGVNNQWFIDKLKMKQLNLIDGQLVGVKTTEGKKILIEELTDEYFLDLNSAAYGIYIPQDEILVRPKFQWFAIMSGEEMLNTKMIIAKYIKVSLVDSSGEYSDTNIVKSMFSI